MESKYLKEALGNPQITRLKQINAGVQIDKVLGQRILVQVIQPYTDADRVEKEGLLYVPKDVKDKNTPLPCTGLVLQVSAEVDPHMVDILSPGTAVMFSRYAGTDFSVQENEGYRVLEVREVLCTLKINTDAVTPYVEPK